VATIPTNFATILARKDNGDNNCDAIVTRIAAPELLQNTGLRSVRPPCTILITISHPICRNPVQIPKYTNPIPSRTRYAGAHPLTGLNPLLRAYTLAYAERSSRTFHKDVNGRVRAYWRTTNALRVRAYTLASTRAGEARTT
jgi:hypothetical protein